MIWEIWREEKWDVNRRNLGNVAASIAIRMESIARDLSFLYLEFSGIKISHDFWISKFSCLGGGLSKYLSTEDGVLRPDFLTAVWETRIGIQTTNQPIFHQTTFSYFDTCEFPCNLHQSNSANTTDIISKKTLSSYECEKKIQRTPQWPG